MHSWTASAVLLGIIVAGCTGTGDGTTPPPADPTTGSIHGLVVDEAVVPVGGALVTITGGANTTTNALGEFTLAGLTPGEYFVNAAKAGYKGAQVGATVVAGADEPDLVKIQITHIATATPYIDHYKLEGYYDCAFSYGEEGSPFITDSCDFAYRTAWDYANGTGNTPPAPRTAQKAINTQYIEVPEDTFSIIQEGFWNDERVPVMMILLSSTPIDNSCDCSETDYLDVTQPNPTFARRDRYNATDEDKGFPNGELTASRGFLSWESTAVADHLQFVVITSLFHNFVPDPAWTFETKENYPVG